MLSTLAYHIIGFPNDSKRVNDVMYNIHIKTHAMH